MDSHFIEGLIIASFGSWIKHMRSEHCEEIMSQSTESIEMVEDYFLKFDVTNVKESYEDIRPKNPPIKRG